MAENLLAQVAHDPLADPRREDGPRVLEKRGPRECHHEASPEVGEEYIVGIRNCLVDRNFGQPRTDQGEGGRRDEHDDGQRDVEPVRHQIGEKPAHQAGVVEPSGLDLFFWARTAVRHARTDLFVEKHPFDPEKW